MQVEDGLAAGRSIELHDLEAVGAKGLFDGPGGTLDGGGQAGERVGLDLQQGPGRRGLRYDQDMALGLREHVHEGQHMLVFPDPYGRDLAAQDLREDVFGVIGRGEAHDGLRGSVRP